MKNKGKQLSKKVLDRQEKIKAVALELFLTKGFKETSLNEIIKQSGGSFSNIYNTYKNKEGLFFEILNDMIKEHFELISSKLQKIKSNNLEEILYSFGKFYTEVFNTPNTIAFGKIIYSQVYDKNQLSLWIEKNKENFSNNILTQYFEKHNNLKISQNAQKLSNLFCTMLKEPYYNLNVLTDLKPMNKKEQEAHVKFIVDIFMNGLLKLN